VNARPWLIAAAAAFVLWNAWNHWSHRPVHPPPGILAPEDPWQEPVEAPRITQHGDYYLTHRAHFEITARVLASERYRFDALSGLVPIDLALGWGPMSDSALLAKFDISQSGRFYFWQTGPELPLPRRDITVHSTNLHAIPANDRVADRLFALRVGEVVHLQGELVDAERDDGFEITTSLSRSDSGAGACEVMLVESAETLPAG
jgi:hypothetical protein